MAHHDKAVKAHGGGDGDFGVCCCKQRGQPAALPCVGEQEEDVMGGDEGVQFGSGLGGRE